MTNTPTAHNSQKPAILQNRTDAGRSAACEVHCRDISGKCKTGNRGPQYVRIYGTYKGKEISVMGAGMGMPSMGIYSYELLTSMGVSQIIRIGSAGALQDHMKLMDVVIGMGACTDSNYAYQYGLPGTFAPIADYDLLSRAVETAKTPGNRCCSRKCAFLRYFLQ